MSLLYRAPIFHVASMARSGETVFLRSLAAHPRVHVVHNLDERDGEDAARLFAYLQHYRKTRIWFRHPRVRPCAITPGDVLVLKQGVWEHRFPFHGMILARNPVSIYASLRTYDVPPEGAADLDALWSHNTARFLRWLVQIDPTLIPGFEYRSPVDQFCVFYNRRMGALLSLGLPVVHYERFVTDPRGSLRMTAATMGLPFDEAMLVAHNAYETGVAGHGKTDLARPVNDASLYKFQRVVTRAEFDAIVARSAPVHRRYGYRMTWDEITMVDAT